MILLRSQKILLICGWPRGCVGQYVLLIRLEAVTTLNATFLGVALGARAVREGVEVPGGTYSGSCSSSDPMIMRADRATHFDRPRA